MTVPYSGGGLQFVLLVPDAREGLPALEKNLTPRVLAAAVTAEKSFIALHLPSFKLLDRFSQQKDFMRARARSARSIIAAISAARLGILTAKTRLNTANAS